MRWQLNSSPPKVGDSRERKGFLLLPKTIAGETRWLEFARWVEHYTVNTMPTGMDVDDYWKPTCWRNP